MLRLIKSCLHNRFLLSGRIIDHCSNYNGILRFRVRRGKCRSRYGSGCIMFNDGTVIKHLSAKKLRRYISILHTVVHRSQTCPAVHIGLSLNRGCLSYSIAPFINTQFSAHQQLIRVGDPFRTINQNRLIRSQGPRCERGNGEQQGQTQCQSERDTLFHGILLPCRRVFRFLILSSLAIHPHFSFLPTFYIHSASLSAII